MPSPTAEPTTSPSSRKSQGAASKDPERRTGLTDRRRSGRDRREREPGDHLLAALRELEKAVAACPPGARRRAAVELVVSRVRRLSRPRPAAKRDAVQIDLEELLAGPARTRG